MSIPHVYSNLDTTLVEKFPASVCQQELTYISYGFWDEKCQKGPNVTNTQNAYFLICMQFFPVKNALLKGSLTYLL